MSHTIDNKAQETKRLTIGSSFSYASDILTKLVTEPKMGGPQSIEEQEELFSDLPRDLMPSSNSTKLFLLLLGKAHIDKDLLNEHITDIKETISRGISANKETLMNVIPFIMQNNPRFFEGYPERDSAAYAMSLFEDALNAETGYYAFEAITPLLKQSIEEPALKAKINELYDNAISRYLTEDCESATKAILKIKNPSTIEKYIVPLVEGNKDAGTKLLRLTQIQGLHIPALIEAFSDATTTSNELGQKIERSAATVLILEERAEKLRKELAQTEHALSEAKIHHSNLTSQIEPDTLITNFLGALDNTSTEGTDEIPEMQSRVAKQLQILKHQ